jgi:hypothetical protein
MTFQITKEEFVKLKNDLIAYPLTRHVLNPQAVNLAYDVLKSNIFMEDGKLMGLKIYPSQQA